MRILEELDSNLHGTPFLQSMFQQLETDFCTPSYYIGYINANILFDHQLITTFKAILKASQDQMIHRRLLIMGRCTDVNMFSMTIDAMGAEDNYLNFVQQVGREGLGAFICQLQKWGELFQNNAQDFFIIRQGSLDWTKIPDFVIGRPGYDNWLVDYRHNP